jgi:steroid 5-alpha reductase family enzyme
MTKFFFSLLQLQKLTGNDLHLQKLVLTWGIVMLAVSLLCFLVSEITSNYSQVDKLWSLMPILYSIIALAAFPSVRLIIMSLLVMTWGLRLSYNFGRKGGYNIVPWRGEEDYRWKVLRQDPALKGRFRFGLFNLFFISIYQNLLILLFCTPLFLAAKNKEAGLNFTDLLAGTLMLTFIITETIADNQLFRFHQLKKKLLPLDGTYEESLKNGFFSEGLWKYSRHPNFASEQAIWICFYLFGVAASGKLLNWTIAGAALLVLLFVASSGFTEKISSEKYPGYSSYRKRVSRFLPLPW